MSSNSIAFSERYIARGKARIYARDYAGVGPAFVLMHGFPDNLHIWDDLIPYLVASGRRVVAFDFLGFGVSDKPSGASYSFKQQLGDLETVVEVLGLGKIVPVAHDASGPAAINFAIEHPDHVVSVCMLNSVRRRVHGPLAGTHRAIRDQEPQCALRRYCAQSRAIRLVAQLAEATIPGCS